MKILIPTDLSKASQVAADFALSYFGFRASYCLLNSFSLTYRSGFYDSLNQFTPESDSIPMEKLKREKKRLIEKFGSQVIDTKASYGDRTADIFTTAEEEKVDLIVLGYASFKKWKDGFNYRENFKLQDLPFPILLVPESYSDLTQKSIYYITDFSNASISESMLTLRYVARFSKASIKFFCFENANETKELERWMADKYLGEVEHTFELIHDLNDGLNVLNKEMQLKRNALVIFDLKKLDSSLIRSIENFVTKQTAIKPMLLMPKGFEESHLREA